MITPEQFTEMCLIAVQARYPQFVCEQENTLSLKLTGPDMQNGALIGLDSLYPFANNKPASECFEMLYYRIEAFLSSIDNNVDIHQVQDRIYPHLGRYNDESQEFKRIVLPFYDGLQVGLVVDEPKVMKFLHEQHLQDSSWSVDSLFHLAFRNLDNLMARTTLVMLGTDENHYIWVHQGDDGYAADRLLATSFWSALVKEKGYEIAYVAIPHRDVIYCSTSPKLLVPFVAEPELSGYPLTRLVFALKDGQIVEIGQLMTPEQSEELRRQDDERSGGGPALSA